MYDVNTLCRKAKFNLINWIVCLVAALEVVMCFKILNSFAENPQAQMGVVCIYILFLVADLCLMLINAMRVRKIREGEFYIYQEELGTSWIIEDEYFILDIVPFNTNFDSFMKSKIV